MIYRNDPSKKNIYLIKNIISKIILFSVIYFFTIQSVNLIYRLHGVNTYKIFDFSVIVPFAVIFGIYFIGYKKIFKNYEILEIQVEHDFIEYRMENYVSRADWKDITSVSSYPTNGDFEKLKIIGKNGVGIVVPSSLENYETLRQIIIEKSGKQIQRLPYFINRGIFWGCLLLVEAGIIFSRKKLFLIGGGIFVLKQILNLMSTYKYSKNMKKGRAVSLVTTAVACAIMIFGLILFAFDNSSIWRYNYTLKKGPDSKYHIWEIYYQQRFDEDGDIVYYRDSEFEEEYGYDENKFMTYYKSTDLLDKEVYEEWYVNDDEGNIIYSKDSDGYEVWTAYYENGYEKTYPDGYKYYAKLDDDGKIIETYDSDGEKTFYFYDDDGNRIKMEVYQEDELIKSQDIPKTQSDDMAEEDEYFYETDEWENVVYSKSGDGDYEQWFMYDYDDDGNVLTCYRR